MLPYSLFGITMAQAQICVYPAHSGAVMEYDMGLNLQDFGNAGEMMGGILLMELPSIGTVDDLVQILSVLILFLLMSAQVLALKHIIVGVALNDRNYLSR